MPVFVRSEHRPPQAGFQIVVVGYLSLEESGRISMGSTPHR